MFINFNILEKNNFDWKDNKLLVLLTIRQKEYNRLVDCREKLIELFKDGYITKVKGNKKDPEFLKARLSKKGKKLLELLEIPEVTKESENLSIRLIELYKSNGLEKKIGNKNKITKLISWFLGETQFESDDVYNTVETYINSVENKFIRGIEHLVWKGESVFSTKWSLSNSKLYNLMIEK